MGDKNNEAVGPENSCKEEPVVNADKDERVNKERAPGDSKSHKHKNHSKDSSGEKKHKKHKEHKDDKSHHHKKHKDKEHKRSHHSSDEGDSKSKKHKSHKSRKDKKHRSSSKRDKKRGSKKDGQTGEENKKKKPHFRRDENGKKIPNVVYVYLPPEIIHTTKIVKHFAKEAVSILLASISLLFVVGMVVVEVLFETKAALKYIEEETEETRVSLAVPNNLSNGALKTTEARVDKNKTGSDENGIARYTVEDFSKLTVYSSTLNSLNRQHNVYNECTLLYRKFSDVIYDDDDDKNKFSDYDLEDCTKKWKSFEDYFKKSEVNTGLNVFEFKVACIKRRSTEIFETKPTWIGFELLDRL